MEITTIIHPGVKIYHDCVIGNNVTIHAGTVIGSDGFGFAPQADGSFKKVPQIGNVVIEDNVEIGPMQLLTGQPLDLQLLDQELNLITYTDCT